MDQEYRKKQHAVYKLVYHLVLVTKDRKPVITPDIMQTIRDYAKHLIENRYGGFLIDLNGEADHIHVLFELPATVMLSSTINNFKTQLSRQVRSKYGEELSKQLWKNSFWSDSYFLTTTGGASTDVLEKYIENQGIQKLKRPYHKRTEAKKCRKKSHT